MNCKRANAEIALWVGNDLDESAERSLRRHLAKCPGCRKHWRKMKASLRMLQENDEDLSETRDISLWPRLSVALATAEEQNAHGSRFNGWVPALAVAAACLAMISLSNNTPPVERSNEARPIPVQPIYHDMLPFPDALWDGDTFFDRDLPFPRSGLLPFPPASEEKHPRTSLKRKNERRSLRDEGR